MADNGAGPAVCPEHKQTNSANSKVPLEFRRSCRKPQLLRAQDPEPAKSSGDTFREPKDLSKHLNWTKMKDLSTFQLTVSFHQYVCLRADSYLCYLALSSQRNQKGTDTKKYSASVYSTYSLLKECNSMKC